MTIVKAWPSVTVLATALACSDTNAADAGDGADSGSGGSPPVQADARLDAVPCGDIGGAVELPGTSIRIAEEVSSGSLVLADGQSFDGLPPFCRVAGTIEPQIQFEVWLPIDNYSGRLLGQSNVVLGGAISYGGMAVWMGGGYAVVSTDTGHSGDAYDATWALGRPDLIEDYGHRSLHLSTVAAKAIAEAFYAERPNHSYFMGCSKGGQQAMAEAQRYPDDYDGIVAGSPAHDFTRFYAGGHLWYSHATLNDPESYIPADKFGLIGAAVDVACDGIDGIVDGSINDPRKCEFDPATLACASGDDPATCLTAKQVQALRDIYAGSMTAEGEPLYPGLAFGGEATTWASWIAGTQPFDSGHFLAADGFFKYMVFEDPAWDFRTFDYGADLALALEKVGPAVDAADPDLTAFRDSGGKLIMYHGWSDPDISPFGSIDYYEAVTATMGGAEQTSEFARLFMAPGMGHCFGGPGPDGFDAVSAIQDWVENGVAPERIVATKRADGQIIRSRPLCPYPLVAQWSGQGSTDDEANFECVPESL